MSPSSPPVVTVVVAAHNAEATLSSTLRSVREQDFSAWECLVIDDGSQDETAGVVERFATEDSRFRLIRQGNAGVGAARNAGIREARGRFIAPLDADDLWEPWKLTRQVACMAARGLKCGVVYGWWSVIDGEDRVLYSVADSRHTGWVYDAILIRNFVGNASVPLFRTEAVREAGGYLTRADQGGCQGCEDWGLLLEIARKWTFGVVADVVVRYRRLDTGMSGRIRGMADSYERIIRRVREDSAVSRRLLRWSAGHFYVYLATSADRVLDPAGALWALRRAVWRDPMMLVNWRLQRSAVRCFVDAGLRRFGISVRGGKLGLWADSVRLDEFLGHGLSGRWLTKRVEERRIARALKLAAGRSQPLEVDHD